MLKAGETTSVTFKVNVMGTSANPTVRLVLGTKPELGFEAHHVDGDEWKADVALPLEEMPMEAEMRVEVLVNGRMFTPMKKMVPIVRKQDSVAAPEEPKPEEPKVDLPKGPDVNWVPEPAQIKKLDRMLDQFAADKVTEEPMIRRVIPPTIVVKQPAAKIPSKVEPKQTAGLSMLKTIATAPAKKVYERVVTPLPKASKIKTAEVKISLSDVDDIAGPTKAKIKKTISAARSVKSAPVKLIKEHLYYE